MAQIVGLALAGVSVATIASLPSLREILVAALSRYTGFDTPGGMWRIAAILLAVVNLKNLPFVWHIRFVRALTYQIYLQPTAIPPHALFQPVITSTRTTLLETDYNLHKSNSTYFSDMDISRTHLFTAIVRNSIRKGSRQGGAKKNAVGGAVGATEGSRGNHKIALGGVSILFKREILPYRKYEMWTRVLCWDRKWFYLITHFVKPGVAQPPSWTLHPWKKTKPADKGIDAEKLLGAVYATAIAKYVIKRGRITVPPEDALVDADMVPRKPAGWSYNEEASGKDGSEGVANEVLPAAIKAEDWNWDVIEAERLRGLKVASKFAEMDGMHNYFDGGKDGVLGEYADLFF